MKLRPFASEFDDSAVRQYGGEPLRNDELDTHVFGMDPSRRVEVSQQTLVLDGVRSFYFAKRFLELVAPFNRYTNSVVDGALEVIGENLMRLAVVAVGSINDNTGTRTKSLPHAIAALERALDGVDDPVEAERAQLKRIKRDINADVVLSLKYLRHVRNKWAGHASLDREFDDWARADAGLSIPLVEDALVRLVNAHQQLADLIEHSEVLKTVAARPLPQDQGEGDTRVTPFSVAWESVTVLAMVIREWSGRAAEALVDQLESPPGYGSPEDTDWRPDSEHQRRRALVDEAAKRALEGLP